MTYHVAYESKSRNLKIKVKIKKLPKKSESQQSVTIILSGEETRKIHMLFNKKLIGVTPFEISHRISFQLRRPLRYTCQVNLKLIGVMDFKISRRTEKVYRQTDRQTDRQTERKDRRKARQTDRWTEGRMDRRYGKV